jgi:hypothetical protein
MHSRWSTDQVKKAMHRLLSRVVIFVDVEVDAMETVWGHLREAGWETRLNPRGQDAARLAVREWTLVVSRESRKSPPAEHIASVERLLVEICFEARDYSLWLCLTSTPSWRTRLGQGESRWRRC